MLQYAEGSTTHFTRFSEPKLPPVAVAKVEQLRTNAKEAAALRNALQLEIADLEAEGRAMNSHPEAFVLKLDKLKERLAEKHAQANAEKQIELQVNAWCNRNGGKKFVEADGIPITTSSLEDLRARIKEIDSAVRKLKGAATSALDVKARIRSWLDGVAPEISADGKIDFRTPLERDTVGITGNTLHTAIRASYFADPKKFLAAADKLIDAKFPADTPREREREAKIAALEAAKLVFETQEERVIEGLRANGGYVARRRNANPSAILQVRAA